MDVLAQQAGQQAAEPVGEPGTRAGVSFTNLLPPVADGDSRRPPEEDNAEAPSAQDSLTGAGSKQELSFVNTLPAAAHDNRGASLPVTIQPAEQHLLIAASDVPAVSSDDVPGNFLEADGGGASDREAAAAAAEAVVLKGEGGGSGILLNFLSLCSPSMGPPRPAGRYSSQTDQSYTVAADEASVHSAHPPSLFSNMLPQPEGQPAVHGGSSSSASDQAAPGGNGPNSQGQRTEAAGARRALRRELFRQKVAAAEAGAPRQPEPRAAEAGQPDISQRTLIEAEPGQGGSRQIRTGQPELMGPKAASASPVTATGGAPPGSAVAPAGGASASTPGEAPAMAAGLPERRASPCEQTTPMRSKGCADPALSEDCSSSSTKGGPEEGEASEAGSPQEAAEGSQGSVHWAENAIVQEAPHPDEELTFSIRRMSVVKRAEQDAQLPASDSAAPEDASSSSSSASSKPEEAALSADGTHPVVEAQGMGAEEVHWAENTALEEDAAPAEDLMYAIRRMSAAVRGRTSPVLASDETAMPARSAVDSPRAAHQARSCGTAQGFGSVDTTEPKVPVLSTPAAGSPLRRTAPSALVSTMSALHPVASMDSTPKPSPAGDGQAAQAVGSPARTGFEYLLARFVGSPAELNQSAFPALSPLAPMVATEPLGERLMHICAESGKATLALRASSFSACKQTLRGSASALL